MATGDARMLSAAATRGGDKNEFVAGDYSYLSWLWWHWSNELWHFWSDTEKENFTLIKKGVAETLLLLWRRAEKLWCVSEYTIVICALRLLWSTVSFRRLDRIPMYRVYKASGSGKKKKKETAFHKASKVISVLSAPQRSPSAMK